MTMYSIAHKNNGEEVGRKFDTYTEAFIWMLENVHSEHQYLFSIQPVEG